MPDADAALRCLDVFEREQQWFKDRVRSLEAVAEAAGADGRQKDADVRQKDADVRQKTVEVGRLVAALSRARVERERLRYELRDARTALLAEQGMLHMRGAVEYVEAVETERLGLAPKMGRLEKWEHILAAHPRLATCLLAKNPTHKKPRAMPHVRAASLMPALYDVLSMPLHPILSPENVREHGPLLLSTASANVRHVGMVACLCEFYFLDFDRLLEAGARQKGARNTACGLPAIDAGRPTEGSGSPVDGEP